MKIRVLLLSFLFLSIHAWAQHSISGFIHDAKTGENLIGATISDQTSGSRTISNPFGHYSLHTKTNPVEIIWSYVGYERISMSLNLTKDTTINILLDQASLLDEVVINSTRSENVQQKSSMGTVTIPIGQIKSLPTFFGERDLIKVLQLVPGVQSGNEGSLGLYVRGGGPDQNLILLDGVPIYNASHLYGFFSTFNSDAINHVELVKGGFPARYGGRLSSVVDITMKEGNKDKIKSTGSVGIISSRILVEGPIDKNSTFLFSARRSYLNLLNFSFLAGQAPPVTNKYYLFDLNGRLNYRLGKNDRVFLSGYYGGDRSGSQDKVDSGDDKQTYHSLTNSRLDWGNTLAALRWNHVYGPKLFSNASTTYNKYQFNNRVDIAQTYIEKTAGNARYGFYKYDYSSVVEDVVAKIDFDYTPNTRHYFRFGAGITNHLFTPGVLARSATEVIDQGTYSSKNVHANEAYVYFEDDVDITSKLKLNAGLHSAFFAVDGKVYRTIQPRVSGRYLLNDKVSIKASYASMAQFAHLLTNAGVGLPTDLWVPSTDRIKPQTSRQWSLGTAATLNNSFELSVEGYYKDMQNVIEYKDGATYLSGSKNWQDKVEIGKGNSYGTEFFLQKRTGKFNGWIGYTLSWTNRQFENLNHGEWFPYRYDRRHDIKIASAWQVTKNFQLGAVFVFATGNAVTIPLVSYEAANSFPDERQSSPAFDLPVGSVRYIENRNNYRMKPYHRMDISATYSISRPKISHEFNLSVYNLYARKNPYYLQFNDRYPNGHHDLILRQKSLITVTPSISYSIIVK